MIDQVLGGDVIDDVIEEVSFPIITISNGCPNRIMISSNRKVAAIAASFFLVDLASTHLVA